MSIQKPTRPHFSEAARSAAAEARRRKREQALPSGAPEVYVVRLHDGPLRFAWEIRRFGGVVLGRAETGYATPGAARSAGALALSDAEALA